MPITEIGGIAWNNSPVGFYNYVFKVVLNNLWLKLGTGRWKTINNKEFTSDNYNSLKSKWFCQYSAFIEALL